MTPIIAIVGRPNVGKSTLFNRLAGERLAIVDDQPGVTRDRHYADTLMHGVTVTLVDTGGFDPTTDDPMGQGIARQVRAALEEADVVLCLLDGAMPPTGPDRESVDLLRRSGKPVIFAANKVDSSRINAESVELYSLGIKDYLRVSALHGRGIGELEQALIAALPKDVTASPSAEAEDGVTRIAILGRPNAGKSSLFNRLSGSERSLVTEIAGTTRDPVDARIEYDGIPYAVVDTAGIRRRSRIDKGSIEGLSVLRAMRAMERADVVLLMCDASEGVTEQDARLLGLCADRGRGIIVALNKFDLLSPKDRKRRLADAAETLRFAAWAQIIGLSALTGNGVSEVMKSVRTCSEQLRRRVPTGELNRFFEQVLATHPPPTYGPRAPRIYYVTQVGVAPPLFVAVTNAPEHIAPSYQRYVTNQLRKAFGFESVPLVVKYRDKDRRKQEEAR